MDNKELAMQMVDDGIKGLKLTKKTLIDGEMLFRGAEGQDKLKTVKCYLDEAGVEYTVVTSKNISILKIEG